MNTFTLKIYSADKVFYDGQCQSLMLPTLDGSKGILANHENMVVAILTGELHLKDTDGKWHTAAVSRGFAEIMNNVVTVLVNSIEKPEDIDIKRAQEAQERAEEVLRQKESMVEYYMSQASLARALNRLKTSKDADWKI